MGGMNSRQRNYWFPKVAKKIEFDENGITRNFGNFCRGCGKAVYQNKEPLGIVDHKDNRHKPHINNMINLQLLCRRCNRIKNPRRSFSAGLPKTKSEKKNEDCEEPFRSWLFDYVLKNGGIPYDDAKNAGAEIFRCSPETTRKYLDKLTSTAGIYEEIQGTITFKLGADLDKVMEVEQGLSVEQRL